MFIVLLVRLAFSIWSFAESVSYGLPADGVQLVHRRRRLDRRHHRRGGLFRLAVDKLHRYNITTTSPLTRFRRRGCGGAEKMTLPLRGIGG